MKQSAVSRIEQADYSGWSFNTLFRVADALEARLMVSFEPVEDVIDWYRRKEAGITAEPNLFADIHVSKVTDGTDGVATRKEVILETAQRCKVIQFDRTITDNQTNGSRNVYALAGANRK